MKIFIKFIRSFPKPTRNRRVFIAYLIVVALFVIPVLAYSMKPENPVNTAQAEIDSITEKVSILMDIPSETPTIATISDASKLRAQQFFAKAQNDDKVLIYSSAQKAILYRPSTNKIIEVAVYKPSVVSKPKGEVAGVAATKAATAVPTKAFSLQDLIEDNSPSAAPTQVSSQPAFAPQTITVTPTPAL